VTTDRFGNVYEGDWNGFVNEYQPHVNSVGLTCSIGAHLNLGGVAVDARGDVFVTNTTYPGQIIEFKHGLFNSRCVGTVLPVALAAPYGIAIDSKGNLIVGDAIGAVDVIAPPYTSITGTLGSGWSQPLCVTIDKANTRAYVSDFGAHTVRILSYPGGTTIKTLGSISGLNSPYCAILSKNYNP
jgi:DNA-binding beta-propeller fold protein YncE